MSDLPLSLLLCCIVLVAAHSLDLSNEENTPVCTSLGHCAEISEESMNIQSVYHLGQRILQEPVDPHLSEHNQLKAVYPALPEHESPAAIRQLHRLHQVIRSLILLSMAGLLGVFFVLIHCVQPSAMARTTFDVPNGWSFWKTGAEKNLFAEATSATLSADVPNGWSFWGMPAKTDPSAEAPSVTRSSAFVADVPNAGWSFWGGYIVLLNCMAGIGQFSLPFAFSEVGFVILPIICVVGCLCAYTGVLLGRIMAHFDALDERNGSPLAERSWHEVLQACVPGAVGRVMSGFVTFSLIFYCVSLLIMAGTNFSIVIAYTFQKHLAVDCSILICSCIIFFATGVPTLYFDRYAMLGLVITALCTVFLLINYASPQNTSPAVLYKDIFVLEAWPKQKSSLRSMASGMGDVMFCFDLHWSFPAVYHQSNDRENVSKSFALVVLTGAVLFMLTTVVGYACWGANTHQLFSENLGFNGVEEDIPGLQRMRPCLAGLVVLKMILSAPVLLETISSNLQSWLQLRATSEKNVVLNCSIVVITSAMAMTFGDKCAHAIGLCGASDVVTMIIAPCAMYLSIAGDDVSFSEKLFVTITLALGVLLGVNALIGSSLRLVDSTHSL